MLMNCIRNLLFLLPFFCHGQSQNITVIDSSFENPKFPGGQQAMENFIRNSIYYPSTAKIKRIQGTVYVGCVIDSLGVIKDIEIKRGIPELNDAALSVIRSMPNWIPKKVDGHNASSSIVIPIRFVLLKQVTDSWALNDLVMENKYNTGLNEAMDKNYDD